MRDGGGGERPSFRPVARRVASAFIDSLFPSFLRASYSFLLVYSSTSSYTT